MKELNSLSTEIINDATFVRLLLRFLYKDNLGVLSHRTYTGYSRKSNGANALQVDQFKPISPQKKLKICSLFRDRIMNANITTQEKCTRLKSKNVVRLIGAGIVNLRNFKLQEF